jgi:transcriptional regulator with XRE-family HTH domain
VSALGQDVPMPESHACRGARRGRRLLADLGDEIRAARTAAGLSLATVARAAGISPTEMSRVERGIAPWLDVLVASRLCAVVGLDLSVRAFPGGNPLRDAGHVRLINAFNLRLGPGLRVRTEVPIADERDQRAWDQTISDRADTAAVELETRLTDAQALVRRVALKSRDSGIHRVLLVLTDTRGNRNAVAGAREVLRSLFPLESAEILAILRAGRLPPAGGIFFIRVRAAGRQLGRSTAA